MLCLCWIDPTSREHWLIGSRGQGIIYLSVIFAIIMGILGWYEYDITGLACLHIQAADNVHVLHAVG